MKKTLERALLAAGKIQLRNFQSFIRTDEKESISSIVTEVDLESEKEIIGIIEEGFPQHNILSEESGFTDRSSQYTWIIDPLDGTSNYAAGLPWFGVLIALMNDNTPVLAGAYLPVQEKLYLAEAGKGARVNDKALAIENKEMHKTLVAFSTDYTRNEQDLQRALRMYTYLIQHTRNVRSTNSLLDFLYVAESKFGGCINMYTHIWDIASPWLIITEAGGLFRSADHAAIDFRIDETSPTRNYPVIAGNRSFADQVFKEMDGGNM